MKIGCIADFSSKPAAKAYEDIMKQYNLIDANSLDLELCDAIVALGGDGLMLKVLHRYMGSNTKIYGMNRGSVGFLMNEYKPDNLIERINSANTYILHPLQMIVETSSSEVKQALAVNEVSLLRETNQAAKLQILVDDKLMLESLVADGIIVATPAGSTAYNYAANGPIIPLGGNLLSMTPISPFRPRRWRGALINKSKKITFNIMNAEKRPVSVVADFHEIRDIKSVTIIERSDIELNLLFDAENNIEDRIFKEQFSL